VVRSAGADKSFRTFPPELKSRIFARLKTALASRVPADRSADLPADEKERIWSILQETRPDFSATKISANQAAR